MRAVAALTMLFASLGAPEAQAVNSVHGVQMHRACFTPAENCSQGMEGVSSSEEKGAAIYIDPRPLLKLADPVTWSPCKLSISPDVCVFLSAEDLKQWNTLYSADTNARVAFVLDNHVIATVISRGPARNPIRFLQADGASPPAAIVRFLEEHSDP